MAKLTPGQQATRARAEGLIALAAPFLDIVLGVGERISRVAEPTDHEYYPIRAGNDRRLPGESPAEDAPSGPADEPGRLSGPG